MSTSDPAGLSAVLALVLLAMGFAVGVLRGTSGGTPFFLLAALAGLARLLMVGPAFTTILVGCAGLLSALLLMRPRGEVLVRLAVSAFFIGSAVTQFAPLLAEVLSWAVPLSPEMWGQTLPYACTAILIGAAGFLGAGIARARAGGMLAVFGALLAWPFHDPISSLWFPLAAALSFILLLVLAIAPDRQFFGEGTVK
jgi:hypothetical protein